jgi:hypothetical protein
MLVVDTGDSQVADQEPALGAEWPLPGGHIFRYICKKHGVTGKGYGMISASCRRPQIEEPELPYATEQSPRDTETFPFARFANVMPGRDYSKTKPDTCDPWAA